MKINFLLHGSGLGQGEKISDSFRISNNRDVLAKLLPSDFSKWAGALEMGALAGSKMFVYSIEDAQDCLIPEVHLAKLDASLLAVRRFLLSLWLVKDSSAASETGFLCVNVNGTNHVTSNFISATNFMAIGKRENILFSRSELKKAREHYQETIQNETEVTIDYLLKLLKEAENNPTNLNYKKVSSRKGIRRISRALFFVDAARGVSDLGVKIANYCTALEVLFSTDASEITHKLSERIAYFLGKTKEGRKELFTQAKRAYSVRSKVVHGAEIGNELLQDMSSVSAFVDSAVRLSINKILADTSLCQTFDGNSKGLEAYFLDLIL